MPFPEIDNQDSTSPINKKNNLSKRIKSIFKLFIGEGARAGYLAAVDQGIISLSNFLATIILARNVSPTELGVYAVGFTILRLVRAIQEGLIIQPLNTFGAPMEASSFKRYATTTGLIQMLLALSLALVTILLGWSLTFLGNDTAGPGLYALWSSILFFQLQEFIRRTLYTRNRVLSAAVNSALSSIIRIGVMIYWTMQGDLTGVAGFYAIAIGSMVAWIVGIWQTRDYWSLQFDKLRQIWVENWIFGRWIMGGAAANWMAMEFYPVMTAGLINFAAAGAYRALQNLVAPIHVLIRATDTFLTPRASKIFQDKGLSALNRTIGTTYSIIGIPIAAILFIAIVFPNKLLFLFYGETYLEFSSGVYIMAIYYVLLFIYSPALTALKATRLSRPIFIAFIAAIFAMATLGILMILEWGLYGTLAGQVINAVVVVIVLWGSWIHAKRKL